MYQFNRNFNLQPNHFISNEDQDVLLLASLEDCYWVDLRERIDVDISDLFNIANVVSLLYDPEDECFYVLSNKQCNTVGFFLTKFYANNPGQYRFVTMWRHLLEVGDATMALSTNVDSHGAWYKELVVGYKTIYINTYNVVIIDLAKSCDFKGTL